jgi:hypothetical protein
VQLNAQARMLVVVALIAFPPVRSQELESAYAVFSVVVPKHIAQSLAALDPIACATNLVARFDKPIVEPLVISLRVIMLSVTRCGGLQGSVNRSISEFKFGDRAGRRIRFTPTASSVPRSASLRQKGTLAAGAGFEPATSCLTVSAHRTNLSDSERS